MAPGQVVSPSMSEALSPASAMAARQASTVSASGGRISRRPIVGHADPRDRDAVLELVVARLRADGDFGQRRLRTRGGRITTTVGHRCEERQPDVVLLLEPDLHPKTDVHVVGLRIDDVGREANTRVVVERHDRDDVRRRRVRAATAAR